MAKKRKGMLCKVLFVHKHKTIGMCTRSASNKYETPIHLNHLSLSHHTHYLLCAEIIYFIKIAFCEKWAAFLQWGGKGWKFYFSKNFPKITNSVGGEKILLIFSRTINETLVGERVFWKFTQKSLSGCKVTIFDGFHFARFVLLHIFNPIIAFQCWQVRQLTVEIWIFSTS